MNEKPLGAATPNPTREGQRIAKMMARAGLCSRRDAEAWISEGRVSVNGKILESPAFNVTADDDVRVDGKPLQEAERTRLFLFHKPRGLVTTARDPEGRPTIFDAMPEELPRVVAVGRLDINTEGLILLTNDGGLARVLELPATAWLRRYRVRAHGAIEQTQLDALREGVTIEGIHYAGIDARLEREQGSNVWLMMGLREGKNREIKRVLEHLGLSVNRLIRVSFGPFELGDLAEGEVEEVRTRVLRDQLGAKLAREAGVNFDAEIVDRAAPPPAEAPHGERSRGDGHRRPGRDGPADRGSGKREPRRDPAPSSPSRKRKHVSAVRAEAQVEAAGPRRRVERGATSDRKGREVKVERISLAGPRRAEGGTRPIRRGPPREGAPAHEARADRGQTRSEETRAPRGEGRSFEKRAPAGEGRSAPREGKPFGKRPFAGEGARPPRGEGRSFEKRTPSGEGRAPSRESKPFEKRSFRGADARPERSEGRSFEKRAPAGEGRSAPREGKPFGKRPFAGEGARPPRGEGRSFEKRAPSGEGRAPSRESKPFEKRPFRGADARPPRGEGRSFEKRPPAGEGRAPSREGKPPGKRSFGDGPRPPRGEGRPFEKRAPSGEGRAPSREGKPFAKPFGKRPSGGQGGRPPRAPGGKRPPRRP